MKSSTNLQYIYLYIANLILLSLFLQCSLSYAQVELKVDQIDHAIITTEELLNDKVVNGMGPVWCACGVLRNGTSSIIQIGEHAVDKRFWVRNHK